MVPLQSATMNLQVPWNHKFKYFYSYINVQMVKSWGGVAEGIKRRLFISPYVIFFHIKTINVLYHDTTETFIDCLFPALFSLKSLPEFLL